MRMNQLLKIILCISAWAFYFKKGHADEIKIQSAISRQQGVIAIRVLIYSQFAIQLERADGFIYKSIVLSDEKMKGEIEAVKMATLQTVGNVNHILQSLLNVSLDHEDQNILRGIQGLITEKLTILPAKDGQGHLASDRSQQKQLIQFARDNVERLERLARNRQTHSALYQKYLLELDQSIDNVKSTGLNLPIYVALVWQKAMFQILPFMMKHSFSKFCQEVLNAG